LSFQREDVSLSLSEGGHIVYSGKAILIVGNSAAYGRGARQY